MYLASTALFLFGATMANNSLAELDWILRLEIAKTFTSSVGEKRLWCLLDWVKDETKETDEMKRVLSRFSRISVSLERQAKGGRAKNEPYSDVVGVRCRMGRRTVGIWLGEHRELEHDRTATADEWSIEREFELWKKLRSNV
jgi:hypothetical protein